MGKVRLNSSNGLSEGIMGDDDMVFATANRGFSDRSIGDEFFRTGRNSGMNVIENPDITDMEDLTDDDFEDLGFDYDGSDYEIEDGDDSDAGYAYHPDVRSQLMAIDQRLTGIEAMLGNLFGSNGTPMNPIA